MRYPLLLAALALGLLAVRPAGAQDVLVPEDPICTLPFSPGAANHFVPRAEPAGKARRAPTAVINVTYSPDNDTPSETWPAAAIAAFEYAVSIWEETITSSVPIEVTAEWDDDLGGCNAPAFTLGSAGPLLVANWGSQPENDTWYPLALANEIAGVDLSATNPEITSRFNADCDDAGIDRWYFGTDANPPGSQVDFVSVVLHEIGHGLGFTGAGDVEELTGGNNTDDTGSLLLGTPPNRYPLAYDRFTENGFGGALLTYGDGSNALARALQGEDGGVFFDGPAATLANGGTPAPLYAPGEWEGGSSYAHLDEATYNGTDQALMTPQLSPAEAIHIVGELTCAIFADQGWTISDSDCNTSPLPVELVAFEAVVDGADVVLAWRTASETDNAGFTVQHRMGKGEGWRDLAFVPGAGTATTPRRYDYRVEALAPGRHAFRLVQRDLDGRATYGAAVEAVVELAEAFRLSDVYPNPFNPQTRFTLAVRRAQHVRVAVYDALGRRVAALHDGPLAPTETHTFTFDAAVLPSGLYLVRASGEDFTAVRRAVLVR